MTKLHPVRAHVRRSPAKPAIYYETHEKLRRELKPRYRVKALSRRWPPSGMHRDQRERIEQVW